ncbi:hypothetical protein METBISCDRAFT_20126, partial [Metschnikowia bicuspidata]
RFDDRFARQNRCEPPPEFPLASPYPSIVHHLSGPNSCAFSGTPMCARSAVELRLTFITRWELTSAHSHNH